MHATQRGVSTWPSLRPSVYTYGSLLPWDLIISLVVGKDNPLMKWHACETCPLLSPFWKPMLLNHQTLISSLQEKVQIIQNLIERAQRKWYSYSQFPLSSNKKENGEDLALSKWADFKIKKHCLLKYIYLSSGNDPLPHIFVKYRF